MKMERKIKQGIYRAITAIVVAFMLIGQLPVVETVYAENRDVTTFAELKQALADGVTEIVVAEDIAMEKALEVSGNVKIIGNGKTIYQQKRDVYDTMFNVTETGSLTLGDGLTLSGKTDGIWIVFDGKRKPSKTSNRKASRITTGTVFPEIV